MKNLVIFMVDGRVARVESDWRELAGAHVAVVDGDRADMLRVVRYEAAITEHIERSRAASQMQGLAWGAESVADRLLQIARTRWTTANAMLAAIQAAHQHLADIQEDSMGLRLLAQEDIEQQAAERYGRDWAIEPEAA